MTQQSVGSESEPLNYSVNICSMSDCECYVILATKVRMPYQHTAILYIKFIVDILRNLLAILLAKYSAR